MTAEEIVFKYIGLEGTLKSMGVYDDVIKCMEEYANQSKWVSVEERLPEAEDDIAIHCLVWVKNWGVTVRCYNKYHKCWDDEDGDDYYCDAVNGKITHWQPLPPAP